MRVNKAEIVAELEDMIHEDAQRFVELRRRYLTALERNERLPYLRTILNSCEQALDRVLGKATQPEQHEGKLEVLIRHATRPIEGVGLDEGDE